MDFNVFRLPDETGATRFLAISTAKPARYSLDGIGWVDLITANTSDIPADGVIDSVGLGLKLVSTTITIDTDIVPILSGGTLPSKYIPTLPINYANGLTLVEGTLTVQQPNTPGNIVVVPADGKLPADILPVVSYSNGLGVKTDGSVGVVTPNQPGDIPIVGEDGKLPDTVLPAYPKAYANGLTLSAAGELSVTAANTSGNIVVVPEDGKLPESILPETAELTYGQGLTLSEDGNELSVDAGTNPGQVVVLNANGKIPVAVLPEVEEVEYIGGSGIIIQGNIISEDWEDWR